MALSEFEVLKRLRAVDQLDSLINELSTQYETAIVALQFVKHNSEQMRYIDARGFLSNSAFVSLRENSVLEICFEKNAENSIEANIEKLKETFYGFEIGGKKKEILDLREKWIKVIQLAINVANFYRKIDRKQL